MRAPAIMVDVELATLDGEVNVRSVVRLRISSSSTRRNCRYLLLAVAS